MSQDLDKLFKQIQKNSEQMAIDAMMKAANEAFDLAIETAKSCLYNYLSRKPKIYKRLNPSPLAKAYGYQKPRLLEKGDMCRITFAIQYNSENIKKGVYKSKSKWHESGNDGWVSRYYDEEFRKDSSDNGVPDTEWILKNYLEGKHGWVDDNGRKPPFKMGWQDAEKPKDIMESFFKEDLQEEAPKLIVKAMRGAIVDFIKTNGGGK